MNSAWKSVFIGTIVFLLLFGPYGHILLVMPAICGMIKKGVLFYDCSSVFFKFISSVSSDTYPYFKKKHWKMFSVLIKDFHDKHAKRICCATVINRIIICHTSDSIQLMSRLGV